MCASTEWDAEQGQTSPAAWYSRTGRRAADTGARRHALNLSCEWKSSTNKKLKIKRGAKNADQWAHSHSAIARTVKFGRRSELHARVGTFARISSSAHSIRLLPSPIYRQRW